MTNAGAYQELDEEEWKQKENWLKELSRSKKFFSSLFFICYICSLIKGKVEFFCLTFSGGQFPFFFFSVLLEQWFSTGVPRNNTVQWIICQVWWQIFWYFRKHAKAPLLCHLLYLSVPPNCFAKLACCKLKRGEKPCITEKGKLFSFSSQLDWIRL